MEDNRFFDFTKFKNIQNGLPLFVGISYLFVFIVVNTFLSKYQIYSNSIFNSEYLSSGTIFTLIFGVLFLSIYYSNKHNNLISESLSDFYLPALTRVLLLSYFLCFLSIDITQITLLTTRIYTIITTMIILYMLLIPLFKLTILLKWLINLLIIIVGNIFIFISCKECQSMIILIIVYGLIGIYIISDIYEKQIQKVQVLGSVFTFISLAVVYGSHVYEDIPKKYGGGKPENITLLIDTTKMNNSNKRIFYS